MLLPSATYVKGVIVGEAQNNCRCTPSSSFPILLLSLGAVKRKVGLLASGNLGDAGRGARKLGPLTGDSCVKLLENGVSKRVREEHFPWGKQASHSGHPVAPWEFGEVAQKSSTSYCA